MNVSPPDGHRATSLAVSGALAIRYASLLVALASCTTDLEPSVLAVGGYGGGGAGSGGGASTGGAGSGGTGGEPLATCSSFVEIAPPEYVICPEPLDFEAAATDCARRSATLAAVGSAEENAYIAQSASSLVNGNLWLGGTRDDQHVWRWPDGTVFWRGGPDGSAEGNTYVRWLPGEPNDSSTVTTDPERCLALTFTGDNWNDRACSLQLPYICEQALPSP